MQVEQFLSNDIYKNGHFGVISHSIPPPEDPNPNETDALFAAELNKLSMHERDEVMQDIHGVSDLQEEEPEFVKRCFSDLEEALSLIPVMDKAAYLRARNMDEDYVNDEKFLLMFLRADNFDVTHTASRLVAFFQMKLEIFGPDKLARDITLNDLDEEDMQVLESGYAQFLPGRDRAGRGLFALMPTLCVKPGVMINKLRAVYISFMHGLKDIETQKKGVVGIAYNVGRDHTKDRDAVWKQAKMVSILPVNFRALHYCYDDEKVRVLFSLAMFVFARNARVRCRVHFGSDMECIYTLMTFGIPSDVLPVSATGEKKFEAHNEFLRRLRKYEELNDNINRIIIPGTYDVLLGRGKPLQKHPGNLRYHHIVETYHDSYEKAQKLEKTQVSKFIVQKMKEQGGRFLKQDDAGWVEIDDDAARYKVSHTFRNHRIAARALEKKAQVAPETTKKKHYDDSDSSAAEASTEMVRASSPVEGGKRRRSDNLQARFVSM